MLKRTVKISLYLLLHVSVQLDHPQGAYAETCQSYNIVQLLSKNTSLYDMRRCGNNYSRTLHGTQYTHHSLKYLLPQRRISCDDVFLLINSTILWP